MWDIKPPWPKTRNTPSDDLQALDSMSGLHSNDSRFRAGLNTDASSSVFASQASTVVETSFSEDMPFAHPEEHVRARKAPFWYKKNIYNRGTANQGSAIPAITDFTHLANDESRFLVFGLLVRLHEAIVFGNAQDVAAIFKDIAQAQTYVGL